MDGIEAVLTTLESLLRQLRPRLEVNRSSFLLLPNLELKLVIIRNFPLFCSVLAQWSKPRSFHPSDWSIRTISVTNPLIPASLFSFLAFCSFKASKHPIKNATMESFSPEQSALLPCHVSPS
jgi:hypothetical protein